MVVLICTCSDGLFRNIKTSIKLRVFRCSVVLLSLIWLVCPAAAQFDYTGYHKYPEFRTWSALPGSGYGLTPDGDFSSSGALAYSTPVAYSLGQWKTVIGAGVVGHAQGFDFFQTRQSGGQGDFTTQGNGTGVISTGFGLGRAGMLTASLMELSGLGNTAFNFQYSPGLQTHRVRYAFGVQDLRGNGGSSGQDEPGDSDNSTSFYGAATADLGWNGSFVTAGTGTHRFAYGFANASTNIMRDGKVYAEFDGQFWNSGITYAVPLGAISNGPLDRVKLQLSVGEAAGRHAYWGVFLTF